MKQYDSTIVASRIADFIVSYLYNKLPRRRVDNLAEILSRNVSERIQTDQSNQSSICRIKISGRDVDAILLQTINECSLNFAEVQSYLPLELLIWIELKSLDSSTTSGVYYSINGEEKVKIPAAISASSKLCSVAASPAPSSILNRAYSLEERNQMRFYTAAMFAQTKFGSTKLKTARKPPARLSSDSLNQLRKRQAKLSPSPISDSPTGIGGGFDASPPEDAFAGLTDFNGSSHGQSGYGIDNSRLITNMGFAHMNGTSGQIYDNLGGYGNRFGSKSYQRQQSSPAIHHNNWTNSSTPSPMYSPTSRSSDSLDPHPVMVPQMTPCHPSAAAAAMSAIHPSNGKRAVVAGPRPPIQQTATAALPSTTSLSPFLAQMSFK